MKNLFLCLLPLIGLSCKPKIDQPDDTATHASGKYIVQFYVVNGDTLYKNKGVDKIGLDEFYMDIERKKPDTVYIYSVWRSRNNISGFSLVKEAGISELNSEFKLTASPRFATIFSGYEGRISNGSYYERTGRPGAILLPDPYMLNGIDPATISVIISAKK